MIRSALGIAAVAVVSAPAVGATLLPAKASTDFVYKYEGDQLPTHSSYASLGFTAHDPNGILGGEYNPVSLGTSGGVSYLHIDTDNNGRASDIFGYQISPAGSGTAWNPGAIGPYTVEIRTRILPVANGNSLSSIGAGLQLRDANTNGLVQFWHDKIKVEALTVDGAPSDTATGDNSNAFHTFRIASYSPTDASATQIFVVWRDGVEIGQYRQNANFTGAYLAFGDIVGGIQAEVNMQIDYLRWDLTGAYLPTPIPEPTAIALLAGLGLPMLRRRRV